MSRRGAFPVLILLALPEWSGALDQFDVQVCDAHPNPRHIVDCFHGLNFTDKCTQSDVATSLECYRSAAMAMLHPNEPPTRVPSVAAAPTAPANDAKSPRSRDAESAVVRAQANALAAGGVAFLLVWIVIAVVGLWKRASIILSIGGGFLAGAVSAALVISLATPQKSHKATASRTYTPEQLRNMIGSGNYPAQGAISERTQDVDFPYCITLVETLTASVGPHYPSELVVNTNGLRVTKVWTNDAAMTFTCSALETKLTITSASYR